MPKAQKRMSSTTASRPSPLSTRNANAPKKPAIENSKNQSQPSSENPDTSSNYIIQVSIDGTSNPTVSRLLSLPPWLTFDKVHDILQVAFGWADCHMHQFEVTLVDDKPMNTFGRPPVLYLQSNPMGLPDDLREKNKVEKDYTLADVYENPEWKNKAQIAYEYDMGDGWGHSFCLLGRATPGTNAQFHTPADMKVVCLGGVGHGPAEDAGRIWGWENVKNAFKHPRKAESKEFMSWYKTECYNGDKKGLDPYAWSIFDVNDQLVEVLEGDWEDSSASDD